MKGKWKWSVYFARPTERYHWALWGWRIPGIRYGIRLLGVEINAECIEEES